MLQALYVEKSNFQTVSRAIEVANNHTGVSFCSIHIVGKLSGLELSRIVDQSSSGNVRVMIVATPQVLHSLQSTQQMNRVRVPESFHRIHNLKLETYSPTYLVGKEKEYSS